jgi:hypothetical protein
MKRNLRKATDSSDLLSKSWYINTYDAVISKRDILETYRYYPQHFDSLQFDNI